MRRSCLQILIRRFERKSGIWTFFFNRPKFEKEELIAQHIGPTRKLLSSQKLCRYLGSMT